MENLTPESPSPSPDNSFDQRVHNVLTNGYQFSLGEFISRGSSILKGNTGSFIGYLLIYFLIVMVLGMVPILGSIANWLLGSILHAGFFIVAWRIIHNKPFSFGNFFDGFKFAGPLLLLTFMTGLILLGIALVYILLALRTEFQTIKDLFFNMQQGDDEEKVAAVHTMFHLIKRMVPLILIIWILQLLWSFSAYIVVFGKKSFGQALSLSTKIVGKKPFHFLLFFIVLGLINLVGALCLLVGLLYTIPLSICAMFAAYESIVGTTSEDINF